MKPFHPNHTAAFLAGLRMADRAVIDNDEIRPSLVEHQEITDMMRRLNTFYARRFLHPRGETA